MDIDSEHLGIPDTQYDAVIRMSSSEFSRIVRDLGSLSESVAIDVSKEGVTFAAQGEIGNARLTLKQGSATGSAVKVDDDEDEDQDEDDEEEVKPKARKRKRGESSKSSGGGDGEVPVSIDLQQNVNLTFSLKYLNNFAKAAPLSNAVALHLSSEVPLLVSNAAAARIHGHICSFPWTCAPQYRLSFPSRTDTCGSTSHPSWQR